MTVLTTLRVHPLKIVLYGMFGAALATVLGFSPEMVSQYVLINSVKTAWQHSKLPAPWPWIERRVLSRPRYHRIHHAKGPALHDSNCSDYPLIDRVSGTWRWVEGTPDIGLSDEARLYNTGFVPIAMLRAQLRWLKPLATGILALRTAKS